MLSPKEYYPLVGKKIDLDRTSYFVHGLVHDNPLISISREFKEKINEKFEGYHVICEDGFSEWIRNAVSFNETEHFGFNKLSFSENLFFLKGFLYNKFILKPHKTELMKKVREMRTIEDFYSIREELFRGYSSEPEGMNRLLSEYNCGTLENPQGKIPLRIRRYLYEAKKSLDYANKNKLNELHILVGCAHELPLEYLLKNQNLLTEV